MAVGDSRAGLSLQISSFHYSNTLPTMHSVSQKCTWCENWSRLCIVTLGPLCGTVSKRLTIQSLLCQLMFSSDFSCGIFAQNFADETHFPPKTQNKYSFSLSLSLSSLLSPLSISSATHRLVLLLVALYQASLQSWELVVSSHTAAHCSNWCSQRLSTENEQATMLPNFSDSQTVHEHSYC